MNMNKEDLSLLAQLISNLHHRQHRKGRTSTDRMLLALLLYTLKVAIGLRKGFEEYVRESLPFTECRARRLLAQGEKDLRLRLLTEREKTKLLMEATAQAKREIKERQEFEKFCKREGLWPKPM